MRMRQTHCQHDQRQHRPALHDRQGVSLVLKPWPSFLPATEEDAAPTSAKLYAGRKYCIQVA